MIVSPKIPSCGHLTQPQGRAGTSVANSWSSVSQEGTDVGEQEGLNIHSQTTVTQTHTEPNSRQSQAHNQAAS